MTLPLALLMLFALTESALAQNLVWAKRAGGTGPDDGTSIAVDRIGNAYVTGGFYDSATFGPGEANETTMTSDGENDIFLAKYDRKGALLWARRAGGSDFDDARSVAIDDLGAVYLTGRSGVTATFGPGEANETTFIPGGFFLAKFDAHDGTLLWAKGADSTGPGRGITVEGANAVVVTGYFGGTTVFGPGEANETTLTSDGFDDAFVARFDAAGGALVWARRIGGEEESYGYGVAVDGAGNSYVTGDFIDSAVFGPGEANETTLSGTGLEIFIAKYASSGDLVWAKRAGGPSGDHGRGIVADAAGNSYVTGSFQQSVTFGPGEGGSITLPGSTLGDDAFVARYSSAGAPVWAKATSDGLEHQGRAIALDRVGDVHVTGIVLSSATFGGGEANETTLSGNDYLVFVARYDGASGALQWVKGADGEAFKNDYGNGVAVDDAGNTYVTGSFEDSVIFGAGEADEVMLSGTGREAFVARFSGSLADGTTGAIAGIDHLLAGGGLSPSARRELSNARRDLQDADDALSHGDTDRYLVELRSAARHLEDAADAGPEVTALLESLVDMARQVALDARAEAAGCTATDPAGQIAGHIANGDRNLAEAERQYAAGDHDEAIKWYRKAWDQYQKAVTRCHALLP
jgi:hypothetical protein